MLARASIPVGSDSNEPAFIFLTYKYRLLPSRAQHAALARMLEDQRQLYNAALQERIGAYVKTRRDRTYIDQCKALTEWRSVDEEAALVPANVQRWTLRRLDNAYKAFFRRLSAGGRAGFPRFKGDGRWNSFGFNEFSGVRFDGKRLRFNGMPSGLRVHMHRPLPEGKPLACTIIRDSKGWSVCFQTRVQCASAREAVREVGVDVGLSSLVTLSDGTAIPNPRHARRAEKELRRRQRALSRCKRGSNRRRKVRAQVTRLHRRIGNARATHLHQTSADLVRRFDLIAVEKLNVAGMASGMLAKSVRDASWGRLLQLTRYKAERAGCAVVEVNPRNTTQACSGCGVIVPKSLSERMHSCPDCGLVLGRDHNAAINILHLAVVGQGTRNVAGFGERASRNLALEGSST